MAFVMIGTLLCLSGCPAVIPYVGRDVESKSYVDMKLLDLGKDSELHMLKLCSNYHRPVRAACDDPKQAALHVQPHGFSFTQLATDDPRAIGGTEPEQMNPLPWNLFEQVAFAKPLIGQHNTTDRFIGIFFGKWLNTARITWVPANVRALSRDEAKKKPFNPVPLSIALLSVDRKGMQPIPSLVLQDEDRVWVFVEGDCGNGQCVSVDEVVEGGAVEALPEELKAKRYLLYHLTLPEASVNDSSLQLTRIYQKDRPEYPYAKVPLVKNLAKARGPFTFDSATIPPSTFSESTSSVVCKRATWSAGAVVMLTSESSAKSDQHFAGCEVDTGGKPLSLVPATAGSLQFLRGE